MRNDEDVTRSGNVSNRELLVFLAPWFRPFLGHFLGAFGLLLVSSGLMILGPLLIMRAIDVDLAQRDPPGLQRTVLTYLGIQIAYLILSYLLRNWLEWVGQHLMARLRQAVFDHLLALPLAYHDKNTPGQLMTRVESDTQALRLLFTTTGVMLLGDLALFVGMFAAMIWVSPRLTLITAFLLPSLIGLTLYFQRQTHPKFVEARKLNARIAGRLTEFLQGLPVLQAFARRRWAIGDFLALNREKFVVQFGGERLIVLWFNLIYLLQTLTLCLILGLGGYWALAGVVTVGTLALFMEYVRRFFQPIMRLSEQLASIQRALASAERLYLLLQEKIPIADPADPAAWPGLKREVRFEHVWFRYSEDGDWILRDVSFTLPAGESWALVGPTGSGKTTIVSLLQRFYDPQQGRILIDNVDLRQLRQRDLRKHLGLVLQDIYLFPGDLTANLDLEGGLSPERIEATAQATFADRFIRELPGGYRAELGERGANLSVGQRQLLSFTRALLRDPQLLILDEATSAVDPATEALLTEATRRLLAGRTALVIAHRLATIRYCQRILVLQHGQLVEQGTHAELLAAGGLYRALHHLQHDSPTRTEEPGPAQADPHPGVVLSG